MCVPLNRFIVKLEGVKFLFETQFDPSSVFHVGEAPYAPSTIDFRRSSFNEDLAEPCREMPWPKCEGFAQMLNIHTDLDLQSCTIDYH